MEGEVTVSRRIVAVLECVSASYRFRCQRPQPPPTRSIRVSSRAQSRDLVRCATSMANAEKIPRLHLECGSASYRFPSRRPQPPPARRGCASSRKAAATAAALRKPPAARDSGVVPSAVEGSRAMRDERGECGGDPSTALGMTRKARRRSERRNGAPGNPVTRQPGNPATRQPSNPATQQPDNPGTPQPAPPQPGPQPQLTES